MRLRNAATGEYIVLSEDPDVKPFTGQVVSENCLCVRRKTYRAQLAIIPPAFGKPKLSRLKPRVDLHSSQKAAIDFIRENPTESYVFTGNNGTGKSHIAWAIYRDALADRRPAAASPVSEMLNAFRRMELSIKEGDLWTPPVRAIDLRKAGKPWLIFIDEFEKARPSEFASEQLFRLLDAAQSFNHQLVITSNFRPDQLRDHWGRIDPVWGNSIMKRLEVCHQVEFF